MFMDSKIHIIGAGVGGLTIASLLAKNGHSVEIFEKMKKIGGRTASTIFKNHILDNGFHIMPFYKKSAIFEILKELNIDSKLKLAKVDNIAFYSDTGFHKYPKGIGDVLQLSLIPFSSRIANARYWNLVPATVNCANRFYWRCLNPVSIRFLKLVLIYEADNGIT